MNNKNRAALLVAASLLRPTIALIAKLRKRGRW